MWYLRLILLFFVCGTVEAAERSESMTGQVLDMGWDTMKEFGEVFGKTVFHNHVVVIRAGLGALEVGSFGKHCVIRLDGGFLGVVSLCAMDLAGAHRAYCFAVPCLFGGYLGQWLGIQEERARRTSH